MVAAGADALEILHDARIVLAVSGGPDSMALLAGAARLVETEARSWRLTVAHLDHGLRADSAADASFVADAAAALELPSALRRSDVAALARAEGLSIEEAGREARYRFLAEIAGDDRLIATAHTLDDAVETVLLNLLRGSGLSGVRGIPARRGPIVRPLLTDRRTTLRMLLDAAAVEYRHDPTNDDASYLRNRVRAEVLPLLESLRAGAVGGIARFARLADEEDAFLDGLAATELERRRTDEGEVDWHDPPPQAIARRVVRLAAGTPAPSAERVEALLEAAGGDRGGLRIELGGGRSASVRHRRIRFERP